MHRIMLIRLLALTITGSSLPCAVASIPYTTTSFNAFLPSGISDAGVLTGGFINAFGTPGSPSYKDGAGFHPVGVSGSNGASLSSINAAGNEMAGSFNDAAGRGHAFSRAQDGTITKIPDVVSAYAAFASGVNDAGEVVGSYFTDDYKQAHGYMWDGKAYTFTDVPGAQSTLVRGINNLGQTVGDYYDGQQYHGFVQSQGVFTELNILGSVQVSANAINDLGQVIGTYRDRANSYHGFIKNGDDIETLDVAGGNSLFGGTRLYGINNRGQIVGTATDGGREFGFLLTPNAPAVPEPGSMALLLTGLPVAAVMRRRKR